MKKFAKGIDVSKWQGSIDWPKVAESGIEFAYLKATEGATYRDPKFFANVKQIVDVPIYVGCYHFARVSGTGAKLELDARAEAENFCREISRDPIWALPPMLDIEWDKRASLVKGANICRWVETFCRTVDHETGGVCGIYTQHSFWHYRLLERTFKLDSGMLRPLWLASPLKNGVPTRPIPGWLPMLVQYTAKGQIPGIKGNVDTNYWWAEEEIARTPSMMTALLSTFLRRFTKSERSDT